MKISLLLAATLAVSLALPSAAQSQIPAPTGWTSQTKAGGAQTFVPSDLRAGEVYSVTVYESVPLGGKTLEEYLRTFAGPVGAGVSQLDAPLHIQTRALRRVIGLGLYNGPNQTHLFAQFIGISVDGTGIRIMRTLFSQQGLLTRYQAQNGALAARLSERAKAEASRPGLAAPSGKAGDDAAVPEDDAAVPEAVGQKLKVVGGPLQPGVYAGEVYFNGEISSRWRLYLYPDGGYRLCDQNDEDIRADGGDEQVGSIKYNRKSGQLDVGYVLENNGEPPGGFASFSWCYYGRDARGTPAIYSEEISCTATMRVLLSYAGPPTKRASKSQAGKTNAPIPSTASP